MSELRRELVAAVASDNVVDGDDPAVAHLAHDVALDAPWGTPAYVVTPGNTEEVVRVVKAAYAAGVPIVARGSGTGVSGGANAPDGAVVVSFARMGAMLQIVPLDLAATARAGITLAQLDAAVARQGLTYPIRPGEANASLGGTVATNAGGMHAVRYGVTRSHVLGLEAVLADGTLVRTGGYYAKVSSGYDVTQLLTGSEGTLAVITAVTVRLQPRLAGRRTVLATFESVDDVCDAAAWVASSGLEPAVCEYLDDPTMSAVVSAAGIDPPEVTAPAYLLVELHGRRQDRVDEDVLELGDLLRRRGAGIVLDLDPDEAAQMISAREQAFWAVRAAGADEIVDVVVPRTAMAEFLTESRALGEKHGGRVLGCGHAGDGNVHFAVFQPDAARRHALVHDVLALGVEHGGAVSGEHGVGRAKAAHFAELGDPGTLEVVRRVRAALDPANVLNPGCSIR